MLQPSPRQRPRMRAAHSGGGAIWVLMVADVMVLVWMHLFGTWLDETSPITATATLGGHHELVMVLASIGFILLSVSKLATGNATRWSTQSDIAARLGVMASLVALAGILALLAPVLLGRLLVGKLAA